MKNSESKKLAWLSIAYVDAGIFLAKSIVDGDFYDSEDRRLTPLFLIHQGLELLYKSCILRKTGRRIKGHNLKNLQIEFDRNFPELSFSVPSIITGVGEMKTGLFPEIDSVIDVRQHERLRYPTDIKGNQWDSFKVHELENWISELESLSKPVMRCWLEVMDIQPSRKRIQDGA